MHAITELHVLLKLQSAVLAVSWLANLTTAHRLVQLEGIGKWAIASVIDVSMLYPSWKRLNPANVTRG